MTYDLPPTGEDFRPRPGDDSAALLESRDQRPLVAASAGRRGLALSVGGAALLGVLVFVWLGARRGHELDSAATPGSAAHQNDALVAASAPPPELAAAEAAARGLIPPTAGLPFPVAAPTGVAPPMGPERTLVSLPPQNDFAQRLRAPALVVDLGDADSASSSAASRVAGGGQTPAPKAGGPASSLSGEEQFATRVSAEQPERSEATLLNNRATLIAQGATITGVLETALNSDLPGFARAVVSRDVRGFDGSQVLIPRGSRVIGQYKSALAQGQSRAFVIWTRVIRPDGASIQIGSPGTDPLGRAGLSGSVNTHFFQRFSGAILLSVINAGVTSIGRQPSTQIVIGSGQDAVTASLAALVPAAIPPTIKVAQGTAIRIFVARDLDFSTVPGLVK